MSVSPVVLCLDIGASKPPPVRLADGSQRAFRSGGGLKVRAVCSDSAASLAIFPALHSSDADAEADLKRALAEQPPHVFFQVAARKIHEVLDAADIDPSRITRVVCAFPARMVRNHADVVANLRFEQCGRMTSWADVPVGKMLRTSCDAEMPALTAASVNVLVINDLVPGIAHYLASAAGSLQDGERVMCIMTGGGCGIAEALCLGGPQSDILIMATEAGHTVVVPEAPLVPGEPRRAMRLDEAFSSATAIEDNYSALTGEAVPAQGVVSSAAHGDWAAMRAIQRYIEGLAYLVVNGIARNVNRFVITGPVALGIDREFSNRVCERYLEFAVRDKIMPIARLDIMQANSVCFPSFDSRDNTAGCFALADAAEIGVHGGLLRVSHSDLRIVG